MKIVADTDILSIFAKVRRSDILKKLFEQIIVPQAVVSELKKGKIEITNLHVVRLTREELKELRKTDFRLGKGERECFVIAHNRNMPLATNEKIVHSLCKQHGIDYFTLPRLLRFAISDNVISREEVRRLVRLIELEEGTKIKAKDEIFK